MLEVICKRNFENLCLYGRESSTGPEITSLLIFRLLKLPSSQKAHIAYGQHFELIIVHRRREIYFDPEIVSLRKTYVKRKYSSL